MYVKYMKNALYLIDLAPTPVEVVQKEEGLTDQRKNMVAVGMIMKGVHAFSLMEVDHAIIIQKRGAIIQTMFISLQTEGQVQLHEGMTILTLLREDQERILMLDEI